MRKAKQTQSCWKQYGKVSEPSEYPNSSDLIVFSHQWNAMMWPYTTTVFQKEYITCIMSGSVYLFFHKQEKELILETGCVCVSP